MQFSSWLARLVSHLPLCLKNTAETPAAYSLTASLNGRNVFLPLLVP